jgi:hypothetical protein
MSNPTLSGLRRMEAKYDQTDSDMKDFMERQMNGEQPDSEEFTNLLEQRSVAKAAMEAQFKLFEKPMKTALNETK